MTDLSRTGYLVVKMSEKIHTSFNHSFVNTSSIKFFVFPAEATRASELGFGNETVDWELKKVEEKKMGFQFNFPDPKQLSP